jgi:hypothetical protein
MLSPRFLRVYAEKCRRSTQSMTDPRLVAEFEAMARDLEDWANDPAGSSPPNAQTVNIDENRVMGLKQP